MMTVDIMRNKPPNKKAATPQSPSLPHERCHIIYVMEDSTNLLPLQIASGSDDSDVTPMWRPCSDTDTVRRANSGHCVLMFEILS